MIHEESRQRPLCHLVDICHRELVETTITLFGTEGFSVNNLSLCGSSFVVEEMIPDHGHFRRPGRSPPQCYDSHEIGILRTPKYVCDVLAETQKFPCSSISPRKGRRSIVQNIAALVSNLRPPRPAARDRLAIPLDLCSQKQATQHLLQTHPHSPLHY